MKKKILAIVLSLAMVLSIAPMSAMAAEVESYESIKQRVSAIYGIPLEIVDALPEEKVRNMDVREEQVVSAREEYVNFITHEDGETVAVPSTKSEYSNYVSSLAANADNPSTESNSWMRIYLIIIDNGATLDISSTYSWLIPPRVIFDEYDLLRIYWENGSYIPDSAEGFYTYNTVVQGRQIEYLTDFTRSGTKEISYAHPMNGSGTRQDEFFHMKVSIDRDFGVASETAWSMYSHQEKVIDWANAISGTGLIAAAFTVEMPGSILSFVESMIALPGIADDYYESFSIDVYHRFS